MPEAEEGCDLADRLDPDAGVEAGLGRGQLVRLHLLRQGEGEEEHDDGADGAGGEDPAMDGEAEDGAVGHAHGEAVDDAREQCADVHDGVEEAEGEAAVRGGGVSADGESHDWDYETSAEWHPNEN